VTCDVNEPARLGPLAGRLEAAGTTVMLDHHVTNPGFGYVRILDPCAEATVMLVHRLLTVMDVPVDCDMARCLFAGLVTDTRNFRDAGAAAHRLAAELIEAGAEPDALVTPIMDTHPFPWLAVLADLLRAAELEPEAADGLGLVYTVIPARHVARFRQEEVDGVVDTLRTAAEAEVAAVVKQVGPARWTVSLRARGRVDVAAAAAALGGGGHRRAAGVTIDGTAGEVVAALRAVL
jgi:phosphoesterase RecJ-like protein